MSQTKRNYPVNGVHAYRELCPGAEILKPNAFYLGSDGGKYCVCSKCGNAVTSPIKDFASPPEKP